MRFLLAVDGSDNCHRAVDYLIAQRHRYRAAIELYLVNAQPALRGDVTMFIGHEQIQRFHEEEGLKRLATARAKLDAAGVPYTFHIGVGDPAHVIVDYAREKGCEQIVIGTRGMGSITGMLLGSVATKVVHLSEVPVLLIK